MNKHFTQNSLTNEYPTQYFWCATICRRILSSVSTRLSLSLLPSLQQQHIQISDAKMVERVLTVYAEDRLFVYLFPFCFPHRCVLIVARTINRCWRQWFGWWSGVLFESISQSHISYFASYPAYEYRRTTILVHTTVRQIRRNRLSVARIIVPAIQSNASFKSFDRLVQGQSNGQRWRLILAKDSRVCCKQGKKVAFGRTHMLHLIKIELN